jgi:hypothetical protein
VSDERPMSRLGGSRAQAGHPPVRRPADRLRRPGPDPQRRPPGGELEEPPALAVLVCRDREHLRELGAVGAVGRPRRGRGRRRRPSSSGPEGGRQPAVRAVSTSAWPPRT